jgi:two-component sensor histidine kinase
LNLEDLYRLLRNTHVQSQGIVDTLSTPLLILDRDLRVVNGNKAFFETFQVSRDDTVGVCLYDLGDRQWDLPDLRLLLEDVIPRSTAVVDFEVTHEFPAIGHRTMLLTARRLFHADNNSTTLLLSLEDATKKRQVQAEQEMLLGELRHRMKNMLAVIHSLAAQTTTTGRSAEQYREAFVGRLGALMQSADISPERAETGDLGQLLRRILQPYAETAKRIRIEASPSVVLDPTQVLPVGLIVHELATNAVKHGALSTLEGTVRIGWRREKGEVVLDWNEEGGPRVSHPASVGFGTRLIRFAAERDLGGRGELTFGSAGLHAVVAFPSPSSTPSHDALHATSSQQQPSADDPYRRG